MWNMSPLCSHVPGWHLYSYGHRQQCRRGGGRWEPGWAGKTLTQSHTWRCHCALCPRASRLCPLLSLWRSAQLQPCLRSGLCLFPEGWWEAQLLAPLQPQGPCTQWLGLWFCRLPSRAPAPRNAERQRYSRCYTQSNVRTKHSDISLCASLRSALRWIWKKSMGAFKHLRDYLWDVDSNNCNVSQTRRCRGK